MVLILEVPIASIAFILTFVSFRTLRAIKHLSVGKSFWIPVLFSGIFFLSASTIAIINDLGFSPISYTVEVTSVSRLIAVCFLAGGVFTYSRKITKNLIEKFTLQERPLEVELQTSEKTAPPQSIMDQLDEKEIKKEVSCKHELGYLRTLKRGANIPEECLDCHRIIECKYHISQSVNI
jgi:hypothetical protein